MPPKSRRGSSRKTRGVTPIRYRTETDSESDETPQPSTSAKPSFEEIILERLDNLQSEVNSLKRNRNDDSQSEARLTHTSKRKRNNKSVESAPRSTTKSHQTPSRESSPSPSLQSNPISMSDSDSDMEDDFGYSPTASFGSTIGSVVTSKLKSKILAGKFVEMSDLLTRTNLKSSQEEYDMRPGKNNYSKFVKNQNVRNLPFSLWTKAFDVFISIYLERATTRDAILREAKHLLTYKEIVSRLMRTGHDWQNYDRHFRLEHEGNPIPWNTTRHDLMLEYQASSNNESQRPFRQQQHSSAKKLKTKTEPSYQSDIAPHIIPETPTALRNHAAIPTSAHHAPSDTQSSPATNNRKQQHREGPPNQSEIDKNFGKITTPVSFQKLQFYLTKIKYDKHLTQYLVSGFRDGFRLDHESDVFDIIAENNKSIHIHHDEVKSKIQAEVKAGPFSEPPFNPFQTSPLNIREKKTPGKFRLIQDLSYPYNEFSINANIPQHKKSVKYASVLDAIRLITTCSRGCFTAKTDIADAYRIIPLHPSEYPKMGFKFEDKFFYDKNLPQGCASSCRIFETFATALQAIFEHEVIGGKCIHMIDDFFFIADNKVLCLQHRDKFLNICQQLGVPIAPDKTPGGGTRSEK